VAVPLGLGPENAIFNAGIIGSGVAGTTITYALAEDVLETGEYIAFFYQSIPGWNCS
jgi:hypothetical membrane protein